jgi:tRNA A-37 threonylcarbamoyl transferase component Bud32
MAGRKWQTNPRIALYDSLANIDNDLQTCAYGFCAFEESYKAGDERAKELMEICLAGMRAAYKNRNEITAVLGKINQAEYEAGKIVPVIAPPLTKED